MMRWSTVLLLLSISTLVISSHGQSPPSRPATQNIVTVSFNAAVLQTAEAQKEMGALQTRFGPRQAQLKALNDEVEALRKQISNTGDKLSDTDMATREQALENKQKQLQRQAEDFKNDTQSESQEVFQRVAQKVYAFLQAYSQQHGYSAVIERGSDAAPVVWYTASNMDITEQLVKAYDAQSGSSPTGSPAGPKSSSSAKPQKTLPDAPAHQ
jgi:outer membrane protein